MRVSDISESSTSALQRTAVGLRAPLQMYSRARDATARSAALSTCHVDTATYTSYCERDGYGVRVPLHRCRGAPLSGSRIHKWKCARPDMDTWNLKARLLGQAGWPARLREPGCPPSEQCKGSCVPRRRLEEGTPKYACHGPARTRRASATRSTGTCSTGKPTSAAIASKGVRWGRRGSVDGITSKPMVAACEAVLPYYLNWNAGFCCYSLRRGPLGHDAERCGDGCRRRR